MKRRGFLGVLAALGLTAAAPAVPQLPAVTSRDYSDLWPIIETSWAGDRTHETQSVFASRVHVVRRGFERRYRQITGKPAAKHAYDAMVLR